MHIHRYTFFPSGVRVYLTCFAGGLAFTFGIITTGRPSGENSFTGQRRPLTFLFRLFTTLW